MRDARHWMVLVWIGCLAGCLQLEAAARTQASLLVSALEVKPGDTVEAGIRLRMADGWHTYWQNPGDSGLATEVEWTLPEGVKAGAIRWPVPTRHEESGLTTYGHEGEVLLRVPLTLDADVKAGKLALEAKVSWLECEKSCVPGEAVVRAELVVGSATKPSPEAAQFEEWRGREPRASGPAELVSRWGAIGAAGERELVVEWKGSGTGAEFFPLASATHGGAVPVGTEEAGLGVARLRLRVKPSEGGGWPAEIPGVLVERREPKLEAYWVVLRPVSVAGSGQVEGAVSDGAAVSGRSLGLMLLFAFVGGLILNVMPCVLPVIALKVLSFVRQAKDDAGTVRLHGLLYGAGVVVSFSVLAGLVIAVQQAGRLASWGMHFQSAGFLLLMTTLVLLVALNLFGVFEVTLGGGAMDAAGGLASKEGAAGAFFNGVLATTLATPCTAPYLGSAVGWAFAQPPGIVLLVFVVIGLGLAAPYVLVSFVPGLSRFLPKPGAWMERFKVAMGFPMLGAGVWLLSLLARHFGSGGVLWVGLFLVCVAVSAWVWGQFVQRGRSRRGLAMVCSLLILGGGYGLALEHQLEWRAARQAPGAGAQEVRSEGGIAWERWSAERVVEERGRGRVVLVDFTADWCVTCQANKKTSIEIPAVAEKLKTLGAAAFLGDYTFRDDAITRELARYGRGGVPLVLVFPAGAGKEPIVLPELLTPTQMLEALERAAR